MQRKLIKGRQVQARTNLSRWTIIRLEKQKKFPKHVNPVPGVDHWFEDEIDAYLDRLATERDRVEA